MEAWFMKPHLWILKYDFWNLCSCFLDQNVHFPTKIHVFNPKFIKFSKRQKVEKTKYQKDKKRNKIQRPERVKVWKTKRLKDKKADIKIQRPEREFYIVMSGQCCTHALFLISSIPHVPCQLNNVTFNTKVKVWCKVEAGTLEKVGKLDGFALLQSIWLQAVYRWEKGELFSEHYGRKKGILCNAVPHAVRSVNICKGLYSPYI